MTLKPDKDVTDLDRIIKRLLKDFGMDGGEVIDFFKIAVAEIGVEIYGTTIEASSKLGLSRGGLYDWYDVDRKIRKRENNKKLKGVDKNGDAQKPKSKKQS